VITRTAQKALVGIVTFDGNYSVAGVLTEFTQIRKTLAVGKQIENKGSCRGMNMSRPSASVLDHFDSPRNAGEMEAADAVGRASLDGNAPRVTIYIKRDGDRVVKSTFQAFGCGFTIACCSALTELVTGKTLNECLGVTPKNLSLALGGLPAEKEFCADLAITALRDAVNRLVNYQ
jgi:NifU-like protein involved in Fe-S cluster formation